MRSINRSIPVVIVTAIIAAVNPCGIGAGTEDARANPVQAKTAPTPAANACDLLTKQDAATALGEAVSGPEASSGKGVAKNVFDRLR